MSNQIDYIYEYIKEVKVFTDKHDYWLDFQFKECEMKFKYIKASPNAKPPQKIAGNSCYDLSYAGDEDVTLKPGERKLLSTGLILIFPAGYHGQIRPRSGLSWKNGLDVMAGVIDNSFEQVTQVVLINHDLNQDYVVSPGDRIAQIILEKDVTFPVEEGTLEDLKETNRGAGFGSSGKQ